jgi:outer membrane immunogenic protein
VTVAASFKTIKTGWTVGGGMESPLEFFGMFGKNWTVKTEYLYVDLGSSSDTYSVGPAPFTLTTKVQEHIVRGGINYHFNAPVVAKY